MQNSLVKITLLHQCSVDQGLTMNVTPRTVLLMATSLASLPKKCQGYFPVLSVFKLLKRGLQQLYAAPR